MGNTVRLYEVKTMQENIEEIEKAGGIEISGDTQSGKNGFAKLELATSDPKEAITGAEIIMIAAPAFAHAKFFDEISPFIEPGQIVHVNTGYGASLRFAPLLQRTGVFDSVTMSETNIMPYISTRKSPKSTHIIRKKSDLIFSAFPASKTSPALEVMKQLYPQTRAVPNVIWTNIAPGNAPVHAPMTVPMAGIMFDRYPVLRFFAEATTPGAKLVEAFDKERIEVANRLGVATVTEFEWFKKTYGYDGVDIGDALRKSPHADYWTTQESQRGILREDISYFYIPLCGIGKQIGVPTPVTESIITLMSIMLDTDYRSEGLDAKVLGLEHMTASEMVDFVTNGKRSST
jgi:opine dehydrogenase